MKLNELNYIIDIFLIIFFVVVAISGIVLFFIYGNILFFGMNNFIWTKIHNISGIIFLFFGIIHLILHIKWLKLMSISFFKK